MRHGYNLYHLTVHILGECDLYFKEVIGMCRINTAKRVLENDRKLFSVSYSGVKDQVSLTLDLVY